MASTRLRALLPRWLPAAALALATAAPAPPAAAQSWECAPCAGLRAAGPAAAVELAEALAAAGLPEGSPVFLAWEAEVGPAAGPPGPHAAAAAAVRAAGAIPWITLVFDPAAPLAGGGPALDAQVAAASAIARGAGEAVYQVAWRPGGAEAIGRAALADYAFLLKRAAVAVSGAAGTARVATAPLAADPALLEAFYRQDVAGYLEAVALAPAPEELLAGAAERLAGLDPGRPVVVDAAPLPAEPLRALAVAARHAVSGGTVTLFDGRAAVEAARAPAGAVPAVPEPGEPARPGEPEVVGRPVDVVPDEIGEPVSAPAADAALSLADLVEPLVVLARELTGDVAFDPYSVPSGAPAWSFVRGEDLGLRVIVERPEGEAGAPPDELTLTFPDPQLRDPERVIPATGEAVPLASVRRTAEGLAVRFADPRPVEVLRLGRMTAEELGEVAGLEERVDVASEREVPVEEILRRLQAFEDAQARRIRHYRATNTTHLRFGVGAGVQSFDATLQGPFFFDPERGTDWAWETFLINGVRWRGKTIPEIPLIQPEKAAALPLEITFDRKYRYRLRGTAEVDGRDAWVVEFEPAEPVAGEDAAGEAADSGEAGAAARPRAAAPRRLGTLGTGGRSETSLYRGTVWIDRELHARVRTRAVQLGLQGEVISNEETFYYTPVTAAGEPAPWQPGSFVLPLRLVAQQLLSVINATTLVERETLLTDVVVNGSEFAERRAAVAATDVTMVRDTEEGLRYLVPQEGSDERVVKEGFDTDKWFLVGGVFMDDALDYPLPLGGIDYLSLDFRGTGSQLNVFFAGALLTANLARPNLLGTRFDGGVDLFGLGISLGDQVYRAGEEVPAEEIEVRPASVAFKLGHPVGTFGKVSAEYRLFRRDYSRSDDTARQFVLPSDHVEHAFRLSGRWVRAGYSLGANAGWSTRSGWERWGLPTVEGELPEPIEDFTYWGASLGKTWHLPRFQKIGAEIDYVDGQDLDRFSKYSFGFFGDTRVHGYQSNRVTAERAWLTHLSYGFEVGELIRIDALADLAWATDEATGLDDELLAGVGVAGTFVGPWRTVVNLDVGVPVAGPDDGFVAYVAFLKLFR